MDDSDKTKPQLLEELTALKRQMAGLEEERQQADLRQQIAHSLQRMRDAVLRMENPDDWREVGLCMTRELRQYMVFRDSSVLVKAPYEDGLFSFYFLEESNEVKATYNPNSNLFGNRAIKKAIETNTYVYRRNKREIAQYGDSLFPDVHSVIDVPFQIGTLAVNSTREEGFTQTHIKILEEFAAAMSAAYRRLEDLQRIKNQEEQLRQAQKMEAIGQLTAGVAHNFNNLLMGILGNINLAQMEQSQQGQEYFQKIEESALKGADLVRQLMAYSRQGLHPEYKSFQLLPLIEQAVDICGKTFDSQIIIRVDIPKNLPAVTGNEAQIKQVLLNLLRNAQDALKDLTDRQPIIDLAAIIIGADSTTEVDETQKHSGVFVQIQVRDNGVGMDEETQNRIFDPFFTTKDVGLGTGLGLSTVYGIVHQHNGWVKCTSQLAVGTTLSVCLPTTDQEIKLPKTAVKEPSKGGETILVIDDEEMIRDTASNILKYYGYTVLTAEDGHKGLEIFRCHTDKIALILLDLSMPHMSGQETLDHLRAIDPNVKVVIFTGHIAAESVAQSAGAERIEKPIDSAGLAHKVREMLDS